MGRICGVNQITLLHKITILHPNKYFERIEKLTSFCDVFKEKVLTLLSLLLVDEDRLAFFDIQSHYYNQTI